MISPKRSADELPGDPRRLNPEYRTWHFVSAAGDENGFDEWDVSVRSGRSAEIGRMRLFRLRMDERFGPFLRNERRGDLDALAEAWRGSLRG
ncbi:hypothetical protein ABZY14_02060 [Streptomyces sp. NPDC006617]|uniref:hypothetical protein n=1 Tax=Streptomyces sp. NPDC006617 TaxID=3155354 RepID=UPI0033BA7C23